MLRPPIAVLFGGAVGLVVALCALTGCRAGRAPSVPPAPPAQPAAPAGPVDTATLAPTAVHVYGPAPPPAGVSPVPVQRQPAPFSDPGLVAAAEAQAVCAFDWHQTLAARLAAARAFATPAYQQTLVPSPTGITNWRRTQLDRESAACSMIRSFVVSSAPNTPTVRFERVDLTQRVSLAGKPNAASPQPFAVLYRVERQPDGRWLVGADGEGG